MPPNGHTNRVRGDPPSGEHPDAAAGTRTIPPMTDTGGTPLARLAAVPLRQRAIVAALLVVGLLLVAVAVGIDRSSSSGELLPSQREAIDELAAGGHCANLQVIIDEAEFELGIPFTDSGQANALIAYTSAAMDRIGCDD
jgi:hypothetical protein